MLWNLSATEAAKSLERFLKSVASWKSAGLFALLSGAGSAIGGVYTYYEHVQKEAHARQSELDRSSLELFNKSIEDLSSDKQLRRITALHTLRQIAEVSEKYRGVVADALGVITRNGQSEFDYIIPVIQDGNSKPVSKEIQIAISGLANLARHGVHVNFNGAYLYSADFSHTTLASQKTTFIESKPLGANFSTSDLRGVDFRGSKFNDHEAYWAFERKWEGFEPCEWKKKGSEHGWKRWRFGANFSESHAEGAKFNGAGLTGALFINAHLKGASFENANVTGADFTGATGVNLAGACADGDVIGAKVPKSCDGPKRLCQHRTRSAALEPK